MAHSDSAGTKPGSVSRGRVKTALGLILLPRWLVLWLGLVLFLLFFRSFLPGWVVFSNDGPLGGMIAELNRMPGVLTGAWHDLNWLGSQSTTPSLDVTSALRLVTTPVGFSKFFAPFSIFFLGFAAWWAFHQLKLSPLACLLGGFAAALSSHFFSTACWGVAAQVIAVGANFLALALLADTSAARRWIRLVLAGLAVGLNVMEGYDIGAIFSLFVAAFIVFQAFCGEGRAAIKIRHSVLRVGLVAIAALLIASQVIVMLITTQIKGVVGMEQDAASKANRWNQVVQWSLPPGELPQLFISGVFGYRMDTPHNMGALPQCFESGNYWGAIGRDPELDKALDAYFASGRQGRAPQGGFRFSGGGEYAGVLVIVVAIWAILQSWRRKESVFTALQRKHIWFWTIAALVSLLLSFGRYAPFYQLFYALPFASTIRNATKFTHPFHWALVILFAYGIHGLSRRYLGAGGTSLGLSAHLKQWWAKAIPFDKRWTKFSVGVVAASLLGWLIYSSSRSSFEQRLHDIGFPDPTQAARIAGFSIHTVAGFVALLLITVALLTLVLSGWFAGKRARIAGILLGGFLVLDLARANLPWVIYWNYPEKYATNPVIDLLRDKPYLRRVAILPLERMLPFDRLPPSLEPMARAYVTLFHFYHEEWKQQHFQFYNIQCLDVIQLPREPLDYRAFENALATTPLRRWELSNTRYLLAPAEALPMLNQFDGGRQRFRIATTFDIVPKPGARNPPASDQLTAVANTNGPYAVIEFTGALDRARLYSNWQVETNDQATLERIASPGFNPAESVLIAQSPTAAPPAGTNQAPGLVDFVSYAPKHVVLRAKASAPSVLLLNNKYDPNWKVSIDGGPARLLRCNYIMQGAEVPAGEHTIDFQFQPPLNWMYVSLAAILFGLVLLGVLAVSARPEEPEPVAQPKKIASAAQRV